MSSLGFPEREMTVEEEDPINSKNPDNSEMDEEDKTENFSHMTKMSKHQMKKIKLGAYIAIGICLVYIAWHPKRYMTHRVFIGIVGAVTAICALFCLVNLKKPLKIIRKDITQLYNYIL